MDFEQFKEQFVEDVQKVLQDRELNVNLDTHLINKPNEQYESLTVTPVESRIGVNLNMDRFYEAYENGTSYDEVVGNAASLAQKAIEDSPAVDIGNLINYDFMKDKLSMEVVSIEANGELLSNVPHQTIEDMAVIYRCVLDGNEDGMASLMVTNAMLENYGVSKEQLHMDAMKNAPEIKPVVIKGMTEMMQEIMGDDFATFGMDISPEEEVMFVATVSDKIHGAGVIAYQDFMDQAAEKLGGDFFVLPSSIHEILLVRDDGQNSFHDLEAMVQEVNATQVEPEEKLTDNVYHYDSKDHIFELAGKFEERMQEKENIIGGQSKEKGSLLAELNEKKKEVAAKPPAKDVVEKATKSKGGEAI